MLAVVEQEQERLGAHEIEEGVNHLASWLACDAKAAGDLLWDQLRIANGRKFGQPGAICESVQESSPRLRHEAGFARPTHASQGHEPMLCRQLAQVDQLALSAYERRELRSEVRQMDRLRPNRWEVSRQTGDLELIEALWVNEILEPMLTEVAE